MTQLKAWTYYLLFESYFRFFFNLVSRFATAYCWLRPRMYEFTIPLEFMLYQIIEVFFLPEFIVRRVGIPLDIKVSSLL